MTKYSIIIIALFFFASCTKEITIDLNSTNAQVVIEGNISDQPGPYKVKISKTVNFSDANNYPPVTGALVIISDNKGIVDTLNETTSGIYLTHKIVGMQGNTYTLRVVVDEKEYNATSTMPYKVNLDTVRFNQLSVPGSTSATYATVPVYLDPVILGNCYRYFQTVNGKPDKTYLINNDNVANGIINQKPLFSQDADISKGDTVIVTMQCIDVNTYNYYYTLSQIAGGGPGGGTTPSNPPNNITGNKALGIFSAHTTQSKKVIAQ